MADSAMTLSEQAQLLTAHPALIPIFLESAADDDGIIKLVGFASDANVIDIYGRSWAEDRK
jgi:hypothetical protein